MARVGSVIERLPPEIVLKHSRSRIDPALRRRSAYKSGLRNYTSSGRHPPAQAEPPGKYKD